MNDTLKRLFALGFVFIAAFATVYAVRAWQGGYSIFGFGTQADDGQFAPEQATLQMKPALDPSQVPGLIRANDEMVQLVEKVTPSVVSIDTEILKREPFVDLLRGQIGERDRVTPGLGSGVIVSMEGHIITNHHVIEGHKSIRVTLHDGRSLPARLINSDKVLDVAVLKIQSSQRDEKFKALKFADSDKVKVGQLAIAVGNPFGLGETVTSGLISARDRSLSDGQRDLFQTSAAINPGNSGGPLLNHLGEIIAINAAIYSGNPQNPGFQGIGFSIPANDVKRTMEVILDKGRPVYGYLGLATMDFDDYVRSVAGNYGGMGVFVWDVTPGSPADEAGLKPNDIITAYDGEGVEATQSFLNRVKRSRVGSEVTINVLRGEESVILKAQVGEVNPFAANEKIAGSGRLAKDEEIIRKVGLNVQNFPQRYGIQGGVFVMRVKKGSLADKVGIKPRDIIIGVNGTRIANEKDFFLRLVATAAVNETVLGVIRDNKGYQVVLPKIPRLEEEELPHPELEEETKEKPQRTD